jgi:hypothetical protein
MIRCFTTLLFGIVLGAGLIWYFVEGKTWLETRGATTTETAEPRRAPVEVSPDEVLEELERTGGVVRRRVTPPAESAEHSGQIAAAIEKRFAAHPRLKSFDISVQVQPERVVLSGRVDSPEDIAAAMNIALALGGEREIFSQIHIRLAREPAR